MQNGILEPAYTFKITFISSAELISGSVCSIGAQFPQKFNIFDISQHRAVAKLVVVAVKLEQKVVTQNVVLVRRSFLESSVAFPAIYGDELNCCFDLLGHASVLHNFGRLLCNLIEKTSDKFK